MKPRVLIGYSCCPLTLEAFEATGCEAWTCDVLPSRGRPDRHLQCDVWEVANDNWDAGLFHPMCTCLTVSAAWAFNDPDFDRYPGVGYHQKVKPGTLTGKARRDARDEAIENFRRLLALPYPKAVENPSPSFISKAIRPADQVIQPNWFGDDASKSTGLWIDRLPKLRKGARAHGRTGARWTMDGHNSVCSAPAWSAGQTRPTADRTTSRPARTAGSNAARPIQVSQPRSARSGARISCR